MNELGSHHSVGSDGCGGWFGQFFELVFDTVDEGFAGLKNSGKHNLIFSVCDLS